VQIADRSAIRLEMAEGDGRHAHIYIPDGTDVIEVSFALSPVFVSTYESILNTLAF
jgi:hypothetical protein